MNNTANTSGQKGLSVTFLWMAVLFCTCLITSNLFVPRLWQAGNLPLQLSGAVLIFPVSYIINDCLTEVYGYRKARLVIWTGFAMCFFVAVTSQLVTMLPMPMHGDSSPTSESFNMLYGLVPRAMLGSLLAFICGSTVNSLVLSRMKVATDGRRFGIRAVLSSVIGELTDSLVFFPIAYAGQLPVRLIIGLMLTELVVKILYEIIILPVTSIVVKKVKRHEGIDTFDTGISYNPFKLSDID